jgi:apolipoprotein N-acyltransferase
MVSSGASGEVHPARRRKWGLLALGTLFVFLSFGPLMNPVTPWFAAVFYLRYLRHRPLKKGLLPAYLSFCIGFIGANYLLMIPLGIIAVPVLLPDSIGMFLPLVIARWGMTRSRGIGATLVLPCAAVAVESLFFWVLDFSSTWSYSQFGVFPLMQVASLTGMSGITFIIMWTTAVIEYLVEKRFAREAVRRVLPIFGATMAAVLVFGTVRLAISDGTVRERTVEAAMISNDTSYLKRLPVLAESFERARDDGRADQKQMLEKNARAAAHGAKIIVWPEYAAYVTEADKPALIEKVAAVTKKFGVYVATAFGGIAPSSSIPVSNRLIWIGPEGTALDDHHKYRTVPGLEPPAHAPKITPIDTPYGRVAGVICADADVPHILKRAGEAGVALLAVPTQDWRETRRYHYRFLPFRAVENGFAVLRAAGDGISAAFDPLGRPVDTQDWFDADDHILYTTVPAAPLKTFYPGAGWLFPLLCLAGLAVLLTRRSSDACPP